MGPFAEGRMLSEYSTFGIGGPARYFVEVHTIEQLQNTLLYCTESALPYLLIGKGSNSLFDDRGFNGLAILNRIIFCTWEQNEVSVGAGYSFALLGVQSARKGLAGLEFASGIPASVGGAVYMNAGASGAATGDSCRQVTYVTATGEVHHYKQEEISFGYRSSCFQKKNGAIAAVKFFLTPSLDARAKQLHMVNYRMDTQPYKEMSAGCVFRNPLGSSAGELIERCGCKGMQKGRAEVSSLHANFIVNKGGATAEEVCALAALVQQKVYAQTGISLEMEMRCISYDLSR